MGIGDSIAYGLRRAIGLSPEAARRRAQASAAPKPAPAAPAPAAPDAIEAGAEALKPGARKRQIDAAAGG